MRTSSKPWYRKERKAWFVELNGKQVNLGDDKALARKKWLKLMAGGGEPRDVWLHDCGENYLTTLSPKTHRTRKQVLDAFAKHVGKIKVSKLTKKQVAAYLKPEWSASTKRSHIKTILACLNRAVKDGLIDSNPLKDIEKPAWERREKILSPDELATMLSHAREPFKTLLVGMVESACRPGEVCDLRIENCFPDDGVWLVANKTKNQTGVKMRPVYLSDTLVELTRKLMKGRTDGHLFLNRYGDPWTTDTVRLRFVRLRKKLGLSEGVIPYGTRHRLASDLINRDKVDSLVVARLLGHSDARMLQRTYYREDTEAMRDVLRRAKKNSK